jgi:hypothetical protein
MYFSFQNIPFLQFNLILIKINITFILYSLPQWVVVLFLVSHLDEVDWGFFGWPVFTPKLVPPAAAGAALPWGCG